jgi:hypothetical protein
MTLRVMASSDLDKPAELLPWVVPFARPCSSVYSDSFSLESLVRRGDDGFSLESLVQTVDNSVRITQLHSIESLMEENWMLQEELTVRRRIGLCLMGFFRECLKLAVLIQESLEWFDHKEAVAEEDWLASLGIERKLEMTGWI